MGLLRRPTEAIFISYRSDDGGHVGRLRDRLSTRFPADVFRDRNDIDAGTPWPDRIRSAVSGCRVLIAVVTPNWIARKGDLNKEGDWVSEELQLALRRGIPIFTLYVAVDQPLSLADLPEPIRPMLNYQCRKIADDTGFGYEASLRDLTTELEKQLDDQRWPFWSIAASTALTAITLLLWLPQAFPDHWAVWPILPVLISLPFFSWILFKRRWNPVTRRATNTAAVFLPVVALLVVATAALTPVLVVHADWDVSVSEIDSVPGGEVVYKGGTQLEKGEATGRNSAHMAFSVVRRWWNPGARWEAVRIKVKNAPDQCLLPAFESPLPVSSISLAQNRLSWKGVAMFPSQDHFDVIYHNGKTSKAKLTISITYPSGQIQNVLQSMPYAGQFIWLGHGCVLRSAIPGLSEFPPDITSSRTNREKFLEFWRDNDPPYSMIFGKTDDPCGLGVGALIKWTLSDETASDQKSFSGQLLVSREAQLIRF